MQKLSIIHRVLPLFTLSVCVGNVFHITERCKDLTHRLIGLAGLRFTLRKLSWRPIAVRANLSTPNSEVIFSIFILCDPIIWRVKETPLGESAFPDSVPKFMISS